MTTGPPKTDGAHGEHWLSPTVVALRRTPPSRPRRRTRGAPSWRTYYARRCRCSLVVSLFVVLQDLRPRARHEQGQAGAEHDQLRRSCGAR